MTDEFFFPLYRTLNEGFVPWVAEKELISIPKADDLPIGNIVSKS